MPGRFARAVLWLTWGHLLGTIFLCGLLYLADRWWPATVLMFLPRGLWALPLLILCPAAAVLYPRLLLWLTVDALLIAGPLTGFNVPRSIFHEPTPATMRLRVLSCNVHWSELGGALRRLLDAQQPDIVALQGWSPDNLVDVFGDGRGWHMQQQGEFLLASRFVVEASATGPVPHSGFAEYRLLTPGGPVNFFDVHLYSPRDGLVSVAHEGWQGAAAIETNTVRRRHQSALLRERLAEIHGPVMVAGDFNTPPESALWSEFWAHFNDAFLEAGWSWGPTHFTHYESARIDHILLGPGWHCRHFQIGPDVYSPHRPLIADLEWADVAVR